MAGFAVLKHYAFLEWVLPENLWKHPIELVGVSYMLFKFIHVLVDGWQGQLAPLNFVTYANYQLAFFTLVAGPIQRYNDFQRFWSQMGTAPATTRETLLIWNRILTGLIKIGPIAAMAFYVFEQADNRFDPLRTKYAMFWFLVYMYAYPVYLYFNFSGYTDIVIGAARLLGFELPENFDRPYLARNIPDFWNRWHISLTHWIRDYVFMTSYKSMAQRFPAYAKYLGWALLFFALLLAGVWHGSTGGFAVFGALNGLGAAWAQIYGDILKKVLGRSGFQSYMRNRSIYVLAVFLTLSYEAFCFLFFPFGVEKAPPLDARGRHRRQLAHLAQPVPPLAGAEGGAGRRADFGGLAGSHLLAEKGNCRHAGRLSRSNCRPRRIPICLRAVQDSVGLGRAPFFLGHYRKRSGRGLYEVLKSMSSPRSSWSRFASLRIADLGNGRS